LEGQLVIGITSRALFDLDEAHEVYVERGLDAYRAYQLEREEMPLPPGTGFPLVKALLGINELSEERLIEVVLISRNDADSGLRIMNSIEAAGLDISRAAFTGGPHSHLYLPVFPCDLFLSAYASDVQAALQTGVPAALVYPPPAATGQYPKGVRIAFDGDAVLFADESDKVFEQQGLTAFKQHETDLDDTPLNPGPFKGFLEAISRIQKKFPEPEGPIRTALVTSRNAPAHKRPIKTLRAWGVRIDESFFLGGVDKSGVLQVFRPHIFFDDQKSHLDVASPSTPSAQVLSPANDE
jgi:5'-nucleotidase